MEIEEIIRLLPLLLGGKASKEQEKEVSRWLEEDEGNPVLYKELCATYYKLHYACRWTDIDPVAASSKIRSGLEKKSVRYGLLVGFREWRRYWWSVCVFLILYTGRIRLYPKE